MTEPIDVISRIKFLNNWNDSKLEEIFSLESLYLKDKSSAPKRILLVEPPFYTLFGYERWHYPVTLTLVGTFLKEKGHDVIVYDADIPNPECKSLNREEVRNRYHLYERALEDKDNPAWSRIKETIEDFKPDIVGITSITPKIDSADIVACIAKRLFGKNVKVVLGGPHAEGMLQMFPEYRFNNAYDYIITNVPNLVDRKPDKKLLLDYKKYSPKNLSSILTLTGCPNSCTFCCNSNRNKIIYRKLSSIEQELDEIRNELGSNEVYILDDCFLSNKKRFREIGQAIHSRQLSFSTGARVMALSPEKIEEFIGYGGKKILVGVESGSQKVLDKIKKRLKLSEIEKRTKWLNDFGLEWNAFIMAGFPFETLDDLIRTEELVYQIKPSFISLNRFTPYPGTSIWQDYYRDKMPRFRDLFQLNPNNDIVRLDDKMESKIDQMFNGFDKYNKLKRLELNNKLNKSSVK